MNNGIFGGINMGEFFIIGFVTGVIFGLWWSGNMGTPKH